MNLASRMKGLKVVVVMPTFNNDKNITAVIDSLLLQLNQIIVINDGSTDSTAAILKKYADRITIVSYNQNRGKGHALQVGFRKALEMGYDYALTMDSDGQHKTESIGTFLEELDRHRDSLIVGSRLLKQANMPEGNTFANKFSNFWFHLQTGIRFPDTQSGFRIYPLQKLKKFNAVTKRYEAELEMLVRAAWSGIELRAIPIEVYYPPLDERISHFHPYRDFARISMLNTALTFIAFVYGYPQMFYKRIFK